MQLKGKYKFLDICNVCFAVIPYFASVIGQKGNSNINTLYNAMVTFLKN